MRCALGIFILVLDLVYERQLNPVSEIKLTFESLQSSLHD